MFIHNVSKRKYSAKHVKSRLQDKIYCTWVINEVKKISIYNINENINIYLAMHIRSMLLRIMILTVQKMHLNKVHFLKDKIFQSEHENLRKYNDETSTYRNHNITEKQLNSVVETVDCKQLISHVIVRVLIIHEMKYDFSSKFIVKLIKILQQEDKFAVKLKADEMMNI